MKINESQRNVHAKQDKYQKRTENTINEKEIPDALKETNIT